MIAPTDARLKCVASTFLLAMGVWLIGCSSAPTASDIPAGASFDTSILDNGTKLFVYRQRGPGGADGDDAGKSPKRGESKMSSAQMQKIAQRGIAAMLLQNRYCRDGYFVLEQYEQRRSYVVRGECRDGADAGDREKFPAR